MSKLLVFDIGSTFGYYRKGFTTTSALTHAVIPRSAVEGLIGAVLGLTSEEYPEKLGISKIAVEITSPVRKLNMKYMHTNPDWWYNVVSPYLLSKRPSSKLTQFAIPTSVEFVVDPRYRIYFDIQDEDIYDELSLKIECKQSYYTPYLGTSSMICFLKYVGEFDYISMSQKITNKGVYIPVSSIIPFSEKMPNIKIERESKFAIEDGLPVHVDNTRTPQGAYKIVYSPNADFLQVIDSDLVRVQTSDKEKEKENEAKYVKFLPTKISS